METTREIKGLRKLFQEVLETNVIAHIRQRGKDKASDRTFLIKARSWFEVFTKLSEMVTSDMIKIDKENTIIVGESTQLFIEVK